MIRSMTGYGRSEGPVGDGGLVVEVRSVNNRQLDIKIHLPRSLLALEALLLKQVQGRAERGRVELYLNPSRPIGRPAIVLDDAVLDAYLEQVEVVRSRVPDTGPVDPVRVLLLQGVVSCSEPTLDTERLWEQLREITDRALDAWNASKEDEGSRLQGDFAKRLRTVRDLLAPVADCREEIVDAYRVRLRARIAEMVAVDQIDETRLAHEVALFADRCDITEEVVRLRAHVEAVEGLLVRSDRNQSYVSIGKELDFLLQEMFRETNTIGSKANQLEVTRYVVQIKSEIEKMREQAQNIE